MAGSDPTVSEIEWFGGPWRWSIEPMGHLGYWVTISQGIMCEGPDGGPYMVLGTRKRAIRKAKRLTGRKTRRDARTECLKLGGDDGNA